ncbi:hypothetical protein B0H14DRAFT_3172689 [Mycena olivaceomarginata]|nr:hypothetical protein B0H14DRAFT_3172689 [Mycena olivaceomarginata]
MSELERGKDAKENGTAENIAIVARSRAQMTQSKCRAHGSRGRMDGRTTALALQQERKRTSLAGRRNGFPQITSKQLLKRGAQSGQVGSEREWARGQAGSRCTRFTQQEECNHFEFTYSQCPFIHGFQRPPHLRIILLAARSADRSVRQRIYRGFIFVRGFDTFSGRRPSARFLPLFLSGRDTLLVPGHNLASPQPVKVLRAHRVALGEQQRPLAFPTYRG